MISTNPLEIIVEISLGIVEIQSDDSLFHISTRHLTSVLWKCGKVEAKIHNAKNLIENRTVEKFGGKHD